MPRALGIDLGTTNSAMAVMTDRGPEIIENVDGKRTTPSVVAVNPGTNELLIGEPAKRQAVTNPKNTVCAAKRFIGRRYQDEDVQHDMSLVPFAIQPLANGDVGIVFDGAFWSPTEISAMVLRKLREDAEARLGERVTQAVVTVPAYFNDAQRDATKAAGQIAGLEVLRVLNEPTAAVLAYGMEKPGERTIAVFDLDVCTFDITIMHVSDGLFDLKATNGDTHFGCDDFDVRLVDYLADLFREREGIDLRESTDRSPMRRLQEVAGRVKIELSTQRLIKIDLPFLTADQTGPKHMRVSLTRAKFEQVVADAVERVVGPCETAMEDAGVSAGKVDDVLLVGCGTRIPAVQRRVEELFGTRPVGTINPDEVVAIGAALQAGELERQTRTSRRGK